jgi:hypothetical protein
MKGVPIDRSWAGASWRGARDNTRRLGESMTLDERLEWLESASQLARGLGQGTSRRPEATTANKDTES